MLFLTEAQDFDQCNIVKVIFVKWVRYYFRHYYNFALVFVVNLNITEVIL